MTLEDIKTEMLLRTERYIEEMKSRKIELPAKRRAFARLYDQVTEEILDFGMQQVPQIIDLNHLRYDIATVIAFVRSDLWLLTARVPEILLANTQHSEWGEAMGHHANADTPQNSAFTNVLGKIARWVTRF